jgi:hypothetical protein
MEPEFSVAQTAKVLPFSADVLRSKLRRGEVKGRNVGGRFWLIPESEVRRLQQESAKEGGR